MSWLIGFTLGFLIPLNIASIFLTGKSLSTAAKKI